MIIGIDASRANRSHKSGVEWYSYHLIKQLAKIDSENEYILYSEEALRPELLDLCTDFSQEEDFFIDKNNDLNKNQTIKSPHNNFKAKTLKWPCKVFWTQGRLSLEMLFNAPDVLFVPGHTLPLIHPKKSVTTIHDVGFARDKNLYQNENIGPDGAPLKKRIIDLIVYIGTFGKYKASVTDYLIWSTRYTLKHSKVVITVSDFSKKEIEDLYNPAKNKIKVVHNGYNKGIYKQSKNTKKIEETTRKYGIEGDYILYVGRIDKKKNIPALLEAFALFLERNKKTTHKLVLVGDASFGYDDVNYAIKGYNLDQNVIIPGWVDETDLPSLFNGAKAFVFPSKYEGFGIPVLQAMACGVPVAASYAASIPEIVGDSALLFNPDDQNDIAKSLEKIIVNKELRKKLTESGLRRSNEFSWRKTAHKTLEIIKNL